MQNTSSTENVFTKTKSHWHGRGTLAWAFWGFGFGGGMLLLFLLAVAFLFVLPFAYAPNQGVQHSPVFAGYLVVVCALYVSYAVATAVMVWRCGDNAQWPGWKYLSRAAVLSWIGNWIVLLLMLLV